MTRSGSKTVRFPGRMRITNYQLLSLDKNQKQMHDEGDDLFSIHYVEHRPDLCLSYGQDWKLVIDPTGDIQMGGYASPEIGDMVMWNGAYGLCVAQPRGPMKNKVNFPLTGTVSNRSPIEAIFKSWKIVLNENDPETGLAPVIFRRPSKQVSQP